MLKILAISSWAAVATLAVFYTQNPLGPTTTTGSIAKSSLEDKKTDTYSVAIFDNGTVVGHFTTRVLYQIPEGTEDKFPVSIDYLIGDGLYELVYNMSLDQLVELKEKELQTMGKELVRLLHSRKVSVPVENAQLENSQLLLK